jgi:UDP-3-O-[3-hydroxymyristoyl] glucosamine N-acyltransferase
MTSLRFACPVPYANNPQHERPTNARPERNRTAVGVLQMHTVLTVTHRRKLMFKNKSILAAATIAALIATPVLALDMGADIVLGAAPEDMTTVRMIEDSAFIGNEVTTSDQIVIGQVQGVYENADGIPVALIALNSDIGAKSSVKTFTVPLSPDMIADGALSLAWVESDLFKALSGNLEPASSN